MKKIILFYSCTFLLTVACSRKLQNKKSSQAGDPGKVIMGSNEIKGMKLFMHNCNRCHPAGEKGVGKSLVDKHIPDMAIHFQVRHGLGDMPSFNQDQLTDSDIDKIISFIRILETNK